MKKAPSKIVLTLKSFPLNLSIQSRNVTQPAKTDVSETIFKTTIAAIDKLLQIEGRIETQRNYYVRYICKKPQGLLCNSAKFARPWYC